VRRCLQLADCCSRQPFRSWHATKSCNSSSEPLLVCLGSSYAIHSHLITRALAPTLASKLVPGRSTCGWQRDWSDTQSGCSSNNGGGRATGLEAKAGWSYRSSSRCRSGFKCRCPSSAYLCRRFNLAQSERTKTGEDKGTRMDPHPSAAPSPLLLPCYSHHPGRGRGHNHGHQHEHRHRHQPECVSSERHRCTRCSRRYR
jgi:hypothetical protein